MSHAIEGTLRRPVVAWIIAAGMTPVFEVWGCGRCDVVGVRFEPRVGRRIPKIAELISVELKMHDIAGVLRQCENNRHHFRFSWAAMPIGRIVKMQQRTIDKFIRAGVGLLSVAGGRVGVVVKPQINEVSLTAMQRNLWRRREEYQMALREVESLMQPACNQTSRL